VCLENRVLCIRTLTWGLRGTHITFQMPSLPPGRQQLLPDIWIALNTSVESCEEPTLEELLILFYRRAFERRKHRGRVPYAQRDLLCLCHLRAKSGPNSAIRGGDISESFSCRDLAKVLKLENYASRISEGFFPRFRRVRSEPLKER
jgi:hypothetical protein